ncbi:hypothetical protein SNE40_010729 [Patella caerulea]|uniref:Metalloendopeptidase n=1 Tax=Patella caerulea TaxID=87958 RepID=A0AAN8JUD5_PATCE
MTLFWFILGYCLLVQTFALKFQKPDVDTRLLRRMRGQHVAGPHKPAEEQGTKFESDMQLQLHQIESIVKVGNDGARKRREAEAKMLWPEGIMPYEFHPDIPLKMKTTVMAAMKHWEDNTCIKFWQYTPEVAEELGHHDRVLFQKGDGCTSSVGRSGGGVQITTIGTTCNIMGSAAHEIGHSLGYYHEQSRMDRDEHVTINFDNIVPAMVDNFRKYGDNVKSSEPYDVGSIMHYGPTFLSRDGQSETISAKQRPLTGYMGQREALSFLDIKTANKVYRCDAKCENPPKCENAGFVNERCRCVCPLGVSGPTCENVAASSEGCGGVLTSTTGTFQSHNYPSGYGDRAVCNWLIQGPAESNITVAFDHFEVEADDYAPCGYDWLEVRTKGPEVPGLKFCGNKIPAPIHHSSNILFLQFRSDALYNSYTGFHARYTINTKPNYKWSDWNGWTSCSAKCGGGNKLRRRECLEGKCVGLKFDVERCNMDPC